MALEISSMSNALTNAQTLKFACFVANILAMPFLWKKFSSVSLNSANFEWNIIIYSIVFIP